MLRYNGQSSIYNENRSVIFGQGAARLMANTNRQGFQLRDTVICGYTIGPWPYIARVLWYNNM